MKSSSAFFQRHLAQTTPSPFNIDIERAEGVWLYDTKGKRFLDMISGVAVSNIGHRHPRVVEAIKKQLDKHMHVMVYGEFGQAAQNNLASLLNASTPESIDSFYFVNSGTESIEAALKLARRATGKSRLIACKKAYHGSTLGSLSVSGNEAKKYAFRPLLPDVHHITFNSFDDLHHITTKTAGVLIETVQGDAGVRIPDISWMKALRKRCDETGALLILDEIQTGFGRTGKLFAFEHFEIVPDIVCMAKGMGGGMPIGALAASQELMQLFTHDPMLGHITTFGGHPVNCAAAHANLQVLLEENWISEAEKKGAFIAENLQHHSKVKEVRHIGLMLAVELDSFDEVAKVVDYCLDKGVLGFWFLSCPESFRLAPPLSISHDELEWAVSIIKEALDSL